VVDFPAAGQTTTDYEAFRAAVAEDPEPAYLGLLVHGAKKPVRTVTGALGLLR